MVENLNWPADSLVPTFGKPPYRPAGRALGRTAAAINQRVIAIPSRVYGGEVGKKSRVNQVAGDGWKYPRSLPGGKQVWPEQLLAAADWR